MKLQLKSLTIIVVLLLSLNACRKSSTVPIDNSPTLGQLYNNAVLDAMVADSSEISHNLIPVVKSNEMLTWKNIDGADYVLAVTFTDTAWQNISSDTVELTQGEVWISMVPELRELILEDALTSDSTVSLRASQLVRIPYLGENTFFVEIWVKPDDIFRPAPDNEITDNTAGLYFPANATQQHIDWLNGAIIFAYFPEGPGIKYPFTRLGYSYDWGRPENEFGVSEFVVSKGSKVILCGVYTPAEYLALGEYYTSNF
jgi:hypothetical protein